MNQMPLSTSSLINQLNEQNTIIHVQPSFKKSIKTRRRFKWAVKENLFYLIFIIKSKDILTSASMKQKYQIFDKMSLFIKTRTSTQCKSHHQKMIQKYFTYDEILTKLKEQISYPQNQVNLTLAMVQLSQINQQEQFILKRIKQQIQQMNNFKHMQKVKQLIRCQNMIETQEKLNLKTLVQNDGSNTELNQFLIDQYLYSNYQPQIANLSDQEFI